MKLTNEQKFIARALVNRSSAPGQTLKYVGYLIGFLIVWANVVK